MDTGQGGQGGSDNDAQDVTGETVEGQGENLSQPLKKKPNKFEIIRLSQSGLDWCGFGMGRGLLAVCGQTEEWINTGRFSDLMFKENVTCESTILGQNPLFALQMSFRNHHFP